MEAEHKLKTMWQDVFDKKFVTYHTWKQRKSQIQWLVYENRPTNFCRSLVWLYTSKRCTSKSIIVHKQTKKSKIYDRTKP